jgi:hypothetical protein
MPQRQEKRRKHFARGASSNPSIISSRRHRIGCAMHAKGGENLTVVIAMKGWFTVSLWMTNPEAFFWAAKNPQTRVLTAQRNS